jgi:3-phosphoshikimate 1-carboxyvinyltransferase
MDIKLNPVSRFRGTLRVPSDKSLTHRAVLFSALAKGHSTVRDPLSAEDCLSTLRCVEYLGCKVEKKRDLWTIEGKGLWGFSKPALALDCGNSGTSMRLLSGILAAQEFESELTGDASLSTRPMDRVALPLTEMGASFQLRDGKYAPFKIQGTRSPRPIHWKNPVASAQVKSAVLLAALHAQGETIFEEPEISRDHTERMLKDCGAAIKVDGTKISLTGPFELPARTWDIPGDFSSAAFFVCAALLVGNSKVLLNSINLNPTRTGLLSVLEKMGAHIIKRQNKPAAEPMGEISIEGRQRLRAGIIDKAIAPHLIDEIPIFAVLATQAEGKTQISGVEELRVKESDRLSAMATNLNAMGAKVTETPDGLIIEGPTSLKGAVVDSFKDHRIAMSMAVASLIANGPTTIKDAECVSISFPTFWELLKDLTRP